MREQSDVQLISLLSSLTRSVAEAKELGTKFHTVSKAKNDKGGMGRGGPHLSRGFSGFDGSQGGEQWGGMGGGGGGEYTMTG